MSWVILMVAISLIGFATATAQTDMQPKNSPNTVRVTIDQSDTNIQLHPGDKLEVTLPATFGTGYSWKVAKNAEGVLKQCGGPETAQGNQDRNHKESKAGRTEQQVFQFEASAEGTGQLELDYVRPWEKNAKPAKVFSLTVQVR